MIPPEASINAGDPGPEAKEHPPKQYCWVQCRCGQGILWVRGTAEPLHDCEEGWWDMLAQAPPAKEVPTLIYAPTPPVRASGWGAFAAAMTAISDETEE